MAPIKRWFMRPGALVLAAALLALAGCGGGNVRSDVLNQAIADHHFNTTIESYKGDQFLLDGAVLSPLDLGAHFAYLKDQGKLPTSVLLQPSDDTKIKKRHRQYMARLSIDYGFSVYYDNDGVLTQIDPIEKNARNLDGGGAKLPDVDRNKGSRASDGGYGDVGDQRQY